MSLKLEIGNQIGTKDKPIVVASFRNCLEGSPNKPICIEDEAKISTGDSENPISVDDYVCKNVLLDENPISVDDYVCKIVISDDLEMFDVNPSDPKGKKVKREPGSALTRRSIREKGESSNTKSVEPDSYCSICMEPKFAYECFPMQNCQHSYCTSCVCQYVEAKVEENETDIKCPDPNCKDGVLLLENCKPILKLETFDRWGSALCEKTIEAMKFYCPFRDCSALLIDDRVGGHAEIIAESECPHCNRLFCAQCKVPWHLGLKCEDFQKLGEDERGREDVMLRLMAQNKNWQRCPKCKYYVERIDGCMFIKCRCGFTFCYGCATEMKQDHYCKKCRR